MPSSPPPAQWLRDFAEHTDSGVGGISGEMCRDIASLLDERDTLRARLDAAERDTAKLHEELDAVLEHPSYDIDCTVAFYDALGRVRAALKRSRAARSSDGAANA